jgi:hypothetical protein
MDKKIQILLGSEKNINSVNVDAYDKVELSNNVSDLMDYDVIDAVNATEVFDDEREANPIYRIYGGIEYMYLLNGVKSNYTKFQDFLLPPATGAVKTIFNSFDFYLTRPSTGYTKITGTTGSISGSSIVSIIDEKFDNWVTSSPTNYPFGWSASVGTNSYITQATGNKAKFFFDNQFIFSTPFNLIGMGKDVPFIYGDNIVIETNFSSMSPAYNATTDGFTVILSNGGNFVTSFPILTGGIGYKKIVFNLPASSGFTRVGILGNCGTNKTVYMDYFKVYISGATSIIGGGEVAYSNPYVRYYEVIATPKDFELFPAGFSNNVYGEQSYAFNFKKDYNVSKYFDNFNFPATELFLYAKYKPVTTGVPAPESLKFSDWGTNGSPIPTLLSTASLNIGDKIYGDMINYDMEEFVQTQISGQTYYIYTTCQNASNNTIVLVWKYDPFIPLRLRYFSNELSSANTGSTSYDIQVSIPEYATPIDNAGNLVWRDIVPQGYTDPLTGVGVDYPFFNKRRYLFSKIILSIVPDLSDFATAAAFNIIWFTRTPSLINVLPDSDLNNIGKPCQ